MLLANSSAVRMPSILLRDRDAHIPLVTFQFLCKLAVQTGLACVLRRAASLFSSLEHYSSTPIEHTSIQGGLQFRYITPKNGSMMLLGRA